MKEYVIDWNNNDIFGKGSGEIIVNGKPSNRFGFHDYLTDIFRKNGTQGSYEILCSSKIANSIFQEQSYILSGSIYALYYELKDKGYIYIDGVSFLVVIDDGIGDGNIHIPVLCTTVKGVSCSTSSWTG